MSRLIRVWTLALGVVLVAGPLAAGTLLVANKSEATLSLLDADSGELIATVPTGNGPHEVAVSPDGRTAVVSNYGDRDEPGSSLTVVDVTSATVTGTIDLGEYRRPHGMAFLDATTLAVTAEDARALVLVDLETGTVERAVETGQEISHMLAVAPAGGRAWVANIGSGTVTVIDLENGQKLGDVATGEGAEGITVSPDGRWVWVTNRAADTVSLIDGEALEVVAELEAPAFPIRAEITPDGRYVLVTGARSGDLSVIDTEKREIVRRLDLDQGAVDTEGRLFGDMFGDSSIPIGIEVATDGRRAWIAHAGADVVQVVDLEQWAPVGFVRAGREPDGMGFSPVDLER
jgi:YVTN family beta-propeller protein